MVGFFLVAISFVIFSGENLTASFSYVKGLFGAGGERFLSKEALYCLKSYGLILVISVIGATPYPKRGIEWMKKQKYMEKAIDIIEIPVILILLLIVTAYLADGSFNPFLYFRF